jgi:hypothetical protein
LQQRLARCEELLQEYATAKPPSAVTETTNPDETWKSLGKLIIDDSGVRFMDSFLWATVHDEVNLPLPNPEKKKEKKRKGRPGASLPKPAGLSRLSDLEEILCILIMNAGACYA